MRAVSGIVGRAARSARVAGRIVTVHLGALHGVAGGESMGRKRVRSEKGEKHKILKHCHGCRVVTVSL